MQEHGWLDAEIRDCMRWPHEKLNRFKREYAEEIKLWTGRPLSHWEERGSQRVEEYFLVVRARDAAAEDN